MQEILIDYIKGEQAEGKSRDAIEQQLIKSGYEAYQIETAFSMIDQEIAEPRSVSPSTDAQVAQLMQRRNERSLLNTLFISPLNRQQFFIVSATVFILTVIIFKFFPGFSGAQNTAEELGIYIATIAASIFYITLNIRRLHYMGMSGWWVFLLTVPFVGTGLWAYMLVKSDNT